MKPETVTQAAGLCRLPEILQLTGVGRTTIWRMCQENRFPQPLRPSPFGKAITVWHRDEVFKFCRGEWKPSANDAIGG